MYELENHVGCVALVAAAVPPLALACGAVSPPQITLSAQGARVQAQCSGFMIQSLTVGCRYEVEDLGGRVQGKEFMEREKGIRCRGSGLGCKGQCSEYGVQGLGLRAQGPRLRAQVRTLGFKVSRRLL